MTRSDKRMTSTQVVLLAANDLTTSGKTEFSEWELSVATWKRDVNRFGMRGFETDHPDHKRVMKEIMGKTSAVHRGLLERARSNFYRLTPLGRAEVAQLESTHGEKSPGQELRSVSDLYDDVFKYVDHPVFKAWLKDPTEPRTWLGASAFLGLKNHDANELNNKIRIPQRLVGKALEWCEQNERDQLTRGPVGGGRAIARAELAKVQDFVEVLQSRFAAQLSAIKRRGLKTG